MGRSSRFVWTILTICQRALKKRGLFIWGGRPDLQSGPSPTIYNEPSDKRGLFLGRPDLHRDHPETTSPPTRGVCFFGGVRPDLNRDHPDKPKSPTDKRGLFLEFVPDLHRDHPDDQQGAPPTRGFVFWEVVPICIGTIPTIKQQRPTDKRGLFLGGRPDLYRDHPDDQQRAHRQEGFVFFWEVVPICNGTIPTNNNEPLRQRGLFLGRSSHFVSGPSRQTTTSPSDKRGLFLEVVPI